MNPRQKKRFVRIVAARRHGTAVILGKRGSAKSIREEGDNHMKYNKHGLKTQTSRRAGAELYEVTLVTEFSRVVNILASDEEEAAELAENRARSRVGGVLDRLGYNLGDVEIMDVKRKKKRKKG